MEPEGRSLLLELISYLENQGIEIKGVRSLDGWDPPPPITNDGYGSARPRRADVIGFDKIRQRVVFGLVRPDRMSLDSEEALEEYNVFLDHNSGSAGHASLLYVILPDNLASEFTSIITHYIHREYWHRIIMVGTAEKHIA
jgi:hypothetical protein